MLDVNPMPKVHAKPTILPNIHALLQEHGPFFTAVQNALTQRRKRLVLTPELLAFGVTTYEILHQFLVNYTREELRNKYGLECRV